MDPTDKPMPDRPSEQTGKAAAFLELVGSFKRILILPHDNPDPDALASAAGLRFLIAEKLQKNATIAFRGLIGRAENRALLSALEIPLQHVEDCLPNFKGAIVLVDTQPGRKNNALPPNVKPTAVIDHHPDWGNNEGVPFTDLRTGYGATSTIVTEYLAESEITIDPRIATALFYGISSETQYLGRETKSADIVACQFLYPYLNKRLLAAIQFPALPAQYFHLIDEAIRNAQLYGDVVVAVLRGVPYPDAVAEVADFLVRLDSAQWALCLAPYGGFLYVSARTKDPDAAAGHLLASILPSGSAGGHGMIAGGRVRATKKKSKEVARKLIDSFLQALGRNGATPQPLLARKSRQRNFVVRRNLPNPPEKPAKSVRGTAA
ncbi:MAG: DHH family phosphoesterase [Candidatus Binatia bacterium]|nr:MAG: DHH family phosphoesterase [Candidatus Binatia bacterium]